ncbi:5975_t:CDS:2 [Entrophospora sp. SA101]|nr:10874_t:CDS:2 [Entrophospora sp. SA101]CAJ0641668.1 5975_t:CDS:2 [Entrophospora sp. SA101]
MDLEEVSKKDGIEKTDNNSINEHEDTSLNKSVNDSEKIAEEKNVEGDNELLIERISEPLFEKNNSDNFEIISQIHNNDDDDDNILDDSKNNGGGKINLDDRVDANEPVTSNFFINDLDKDLPPLPNHNSSQSKSFSDSNITSTIPLRPLSPSLTLPMEQYSNFAMHQQNPSESSIYLESQQLQFLNNNFSHTQDPSTQSSYIQTRSATPQVLTDRSISAMTQMTPTSPQVINTIKIPFQPTKTWVDISHIPPYERKFKQIKSLEQIWSMPATVDNRPTLLFWYILFFVSILFLIMLIIIIVLAAT